MFGFVLILALAQIIGIGVLAQMKKGRTGVGWSVITAALDAAGFWFANHAIWSQPEVVWGAKKVSESTEIAGILTVIVVVGGVMLLIVGTLPDKRAAPASTGYVPPSPYAPGAAHEKACPRCAETIKRAAKVCRFCGAEQPTDAAEREAPTGMAAVTAPSPLEGMPVRHTDFGVGFAVREVEAGKILVRFESGHQVVREADIIRSPAQKSAVSSSALRSGQPVKHPVYGRGHFLRTTEERGHGIARFINGDRVVALAELEFTAGD